MKEYIMRYENEVLQLLPDKMQELVRCKDCTFFDNYNVECMKHHAPNPPYDKWFCADGERKDKRIAKSLIKEAGYVLPVRCKDCKYGEMDTEHDLLPIIHCYNPDNGVNIVTHRRDWYCADGERKESK